MVKCVGGRGGATPEGVYQHEKTKVGQSGLGRCANIRARAGGPMTSGTRSRYPGAQPFSDDEFSAKTFFGRQRVTTVVSDQIIANRLLVLYAKSGLGKTSLLSAGVAPRLRSDGYLPLSVRVNDMLRGLVVSVYAGVGTEAHRQNVKYVAGSRESLWAFFKTAQFWQGDVMLTPVLILDQFEELFTLHNEESRASLLSSLGYLVRGVCPPGVSDENSTPPALRIVLSLREDYLGMLEDAVDDIPQILDHRCRLTPLTLDAAREVMTGPAALSDRVFSTQPFVYDADAVRLTLNHLSDHTERANQASRYIEPFHLQLVCQRVEHLVKERQQQGINRPVSAQDLGGESGLATTLRLL